jgi:hypothetical protein
MQLRKLFLLIALTGILCANCLAGDSSMDRATLRGLKAVNVVVDPLNADMERMGLSRDSLRSNIEQKLRDAGIKIDNEVGEFLGLNVSSARMRRGPQALLLNLGVFQVVILNREKATKTVAETWGAQMVMAVSPKAMDRAVVETLDEMIAQFITAYRAVNPL